MWITYVYGETNFKTLALPSTCVYGSLSIESDAKATKRKLKIGSRHMNPTSSYSVNNIQSNSARILRVSHEEVDADLLMPCSVFTVFLELSFLNRPPVRFEYDIDSFDAVRGTKVSDTSTSQSLSTLTKFVDKLKDTLKQIQDLSLVILATKVNFSAIAIEASTSSLVYKNSS
ncbi:hypothetical protein CLU79DRAFT_827264 [Phycomyces nitens]|nr:hypothetical protein CLU79DRAFT_827264 [Phycomyces nitens]